MADVKDDVAIRKRAQISKANRTMFIWVAIASSIISFALVSSFFLAKRLAFNTTVIGAKQKTVKTLKANNAAVSGLESSIRALNSDPNLIAAKTSDEDKAVQVILDALPSEANTSALGASLQDKLLAGIDGLSLDSLSVDSINADGTDASATADSGTATTANALPFTFTVSGSSDALQTALTRLERSIRTIDITSISIQASDNGSNSMTVQAQAYYQPAQQVTLKDEVKKP